MGSLYKTWLPNVSAYLSLRHIGGITHARNHDENLRPVESKNSQWRSFLQLRALSERPGIGANRHPQARYAFLFQAKIEENVKTGLAESFNGLVFVLPAVHRAHLDELHITDFDYLHEKQSHLLKNIRDASDSLKLPLIAVKFELGVDGFLCLESLHETTEYERNPTDPQISYGQQNVFEVYAFLRDAFHKHKFHSERDDYVLEPYWVDKDNDHSWVGRVARSLHRAVISGYRGDDESMCDQALGKLAYLEAFFAATKEKGLEEYLPNLSIDTLRSAICATKQEKAESTKDGEQRKQVLVAVFAIFIPFFFVLLQLLQVPCIDGLNYDYKAAVPATATSQGSPENGNCTRGKFQISQSFLDLVGSVLEHLHWVMVFGVICAFLVSLWIYRRSWLPWIKLWALHRLTSLFRLAATEHQAMTNIIVAMMIAIANLGFFATAKAIRFNPSWWASGQWAILGLGLLGGVYAGLQLYRIYRGANIH